MSVILFCSSISSRSLFLVSFPLRLTYVNDLPGKLRALCNSENSEIEVKTGASMQGRLQQEIPSSRAYALKKMMCTMCLFGQISTVKYRTLKQFSVYMETG